MNIKKIFVKVPESVETNSIIEKSTEDDNKRKLYFCDNTGEIIIKGKYYGLSTDLRHDITSIKDVVNDTWETFVTSVILYTSSDANIVTPYKSNTFEYNIISNTYEDGQGEIMFDGIITTINDYVFKDRSTLLTITIPDSVNTISNYTFNYCKSLKSIEIPDSVTTIGYGAFGGCSSMQEYIFKSVTPPTLQSSYIFTGSSEFVIYVPDESVDAYKTATNWSSYSSRIVSINNRTTE